MAYKSRSRNKKYVKKLHTADKILNSVKFKEKETKEALLRDVKNSIRKLLILILWLTVSVNCFSQAYDVVVRNNVYTSYFSNTLKIPSVVTYKLYKGGGNCSRSNFYFKNDNPNLITATDKDYSHSGYDKGHCAPAEDFAYDCIKDEMTFRYYNCDPQDKRLNRVLWLSYERVERGLSQKDSVFIVVVNCYNGVHIGNFVAVPGICIKCIFSLTSHKCILAVACSNAVNCSCNRYTISQLDTDYHIQIENFVPFIINP